MESLKSEIKIIECPRDAMQGFAHFIPTEVKIQYLNTLLKVGFDTIDFGSFVSPKYIPQMRDTALVLDGLNFSSPQTKLLAIVANARGAGDACKFEQIKYIGFPLSASETFQKKNTNQSIFQAFETVEIISGLCTKNKKVPVIYISMGFGNPYNDFYNLSIIYEMVTVLCSLGIKIISFADTIGMASPIQIADLFSSIVPSYPEIEFGVHLHSSPKDIEEKISAAFHAGCTRFDGALKGFGGCPMAGNELVGNIPTEIIVDFFKANKIGLGIDESALAEALKESGKVFANTLVD